MEFTHEGITSYHRHLDQGFLGGPAGWFPKNVNTVFDFNRRQAAIRVCVSP